MKAIFCHDLPVNRDINGNYCSTTLTNSLFSRYLNVADELIVAIRVNNISTTFEEAHQEKISLPGIKIFEMPNLNSIKGILIDRKKARKILKEKIESADLVFIRGGAVADMASEIAIKLKKPYLIEVGGCAWDAYWNHSIKGKFIALIMELRTKRQVSKASYAVYVTQTWLQKRYPCMGVCEGISDVLLPAYNKEILNKRLKKIELMKTRDILVIGTTAAVNVRYKGQQYIIKAVSKLKSKGIDVRYELVGGGDNTFLAETARKYGVEDRVILKGQMTHDEVLEWLDSIDVYAQPSKQEGLPRAMLEAMSRGCPAIGSTAGGIFELIEKKYIFRADNINRICSIITSLNKENLIESANNNFNKAKEFDSQTLDKKRNEFFKKYADDILNSGVTVNEK